MKRRLRESPSLVTFEICNIHMIEGKKNQKDQKDQKEKKTFVSCPLRFLISSSHAPG